MTWWSNIDARCKSDDYPGAVASRSNLATLSALRDAQRLIPRDKRGKVEDVFSLYQKGTFKVLLATPTDRFGRNPSLKADYLSDAYFGTLRACQEDKSWLIVQPGNVWTEIDLQPYCDEPYSPREVDITVFDVPHEGVYVELVTNAPATIPYYLYKLVRAKFEFLRAEGFSGC